MPFLVILGLVFVILVGMGFRAKHAFILMLFGFFFFWMLRFGLSLLLRSVTGFILLGIVVYLFVRFWGEAKPGRR